MSVLRLIGGLCGVAALVLAAGTVGNFDYAAELTTEAMEKEMRVQRALAMPPADPIYERPAELLRLTPPVPCVRLEGEHRGMGREWIRSWGDGAYRPAMPTCVRASDESFEQDTGTL